MASLKSWKTNHPACPGQRDWADDKAVFYSTRDGHSVRFHLLGRSCRVTALAEQTNLKREFQVSAVELQDSRLKKK